MDKFPLFSRLPEVAVEEAQELINNFKLQLIKAAEEALGNLYCDIVIYLETDSWTNFRRELLDGLQNYNNRKIQAEYDFKKIRQAIFKEYHDEIIADLNQDSLEQIKALEEQNKRLEDSLREKYRY